VKKLFVTLLCFCFIVALVACGSGKIDLSEEDEFAGTSDSYGIVEVTAERDALNYLTGNMNLPRDMVGMRPYCVSVNNLSGSWPHYGISQADIVLEIETEGGITRLMCLFADTREVPLIGSVRSLRDQFIEVIYPLDPIIVHIGTSIYADRALAENNLCTLDGNEMPSIIWIDRVRMQTYSSEHCKFTSGKLIDEGIKKANFDTKSSSTIKTYFNFAQPGEKVVLTGGDAAAIKFEFGRDGKTIYDGDFRYDEASGTYLKFQRGQAQIDAGNNDKQLAFENVLVMFANITVKNSSMTDVDYQQGGEGYYFSGGRYEKVTWSKGNYSSNFEFKKADGSDLVVNTGTTFFGFVKNENQKTLKIDEA